MCCALASESDLSPISGCYDFGKLGYNCQQLFIDESEPRRVLAQWLVYFIGLRMKRWVGSSVKAKLMLCVDFILYLFIVIDNE